MKKQTEIMDQKILDSIEEKIDTIIDIQEEVIGVKKSVDGFEARLTALEMNTNKKRLDGAVKRDNPPGGMSDELWAEERWLRGYLLSGCPDTHYREMGKSIMEETHPKRLAEWTDRGRDFDRVSKATLLSSADLVPVPVFSEVIARRFEEASVRARSTVRTLTSDTLKVPKISSQFSAALVPENSAFPDGAGSYQSISLNAIKFGSLGTLALELVEDSAVTIVTDFMTRVVGAAVELENAQALEGDGAGNNFTGLFAAAGVVAVALGATPANLDVFMTMLTSLPASETIPGELTWFMHPKGMRKIMSIKRATELDPMLGPDGILRSFLGVPVVLTDQIANNRGAGTNETTIYLGSFRPGMLFADRGVQHLDTSISATDAVWTNGLVGVRYYRRTAIAVALATVFSKGTGMVV